MRIQTFLSAIALAAITATSAHADGELNLYSSRHYDTDERLYSDFEAATGITVNRIEAKAGALMERMRAEGKNSPADVLLTVDAGNLWRAGEAGLFQAIESDVLNARIPDNLRATDGTWYAFSQRARMIFYAKDRVENPPQTYEALADPQYKGMVCARSSSNIYMQSLLASIVTHADVDTATAWTQGFYDNLARKPQGGDTDQLRGLISGECDIAVANSYYFARALRKPVKSLSDGIDGIGWIFPNQDDRGTHVNVSGGGVAAHAPNRDNAILFLEYLASDAAQAYFSAGNDEFPVVDGAEVSAEVAALGEFDADGLNVSELGAQQKEAQMIYDRVGYP